VSNNVLCNVLPNKNLGQAKEENSDGEADLTELIEALESVDINGPLAKLNKISISDNNGGRIKLHKTVK
jgi:hypothetical protein